jgi:bifunctional non-homologous end joining protein LigD
LALAPIGHEAVLDGEIVCRDAEGKPQFYELLRRRGQPCFVAFDLLWLGDRDLWPLPLIERKARLERIMPSGSRLIFARHIDGDGTGLFDAVCHEDLEWSESENRDRISTAAIAIRRGSRRRTRNTRRLEDAMTCSHGGWERRGQRPV